VVSRAGRGKQTSGAHVPASIAFVHIYFYSEAGYTIYHSLNEKEH
jgi:hypothetical protein